VSLSWRDRLLISLAPAELAWVRLAGVVKPQAIAKRVLPVEAGYGARPWDGVVEALRAEAAQWVHHRLAARIVLSNHFVRYALIPPSEAVSGPDEELALARFHFQKIHGDASRGWAVRLSPGGSSQPRMACAVDAALLQALRQIFPAGQQARLESVQPLLMSVFNHAAGDIPANGAWLVMAEPERACVALLKGKTWHAVQNIKGAYADAASWVDLVERERWRVELDSVPDTVLIHAASNAAAPPRMQGAWQLANLHTHWPGGLLAARDGVYRNALSAR